MESQIVRTIVLPTRPQPDTIVAVFLLQTFGEEKFPGIKNAELKVSQNVEQNRENDYLKKGIILLDAGGGTFDHHGRVPKTTTSRLVADFLGVSERASLIKMLEYARRDDFFGKGTISPDPLDRAFGLSALVAVLNKDYPHDANRVLRNVLPMLESHYHEEERRTRELPEEFRAKRNSGDAVEFFVKQSGKNLKAVMVRSNNPSLAGYLRSSLGGKYDVVLQRADAGYTNILTRPAKRIDLRNLAALVRIREAEKQMADIPETLYKEFMRPGRHPAIKEWYYDKATNSIQNGGLNPSGIEPTKITLEEFADILTEGLSGR